MRKLLRTIVGGYILITVTPMVIGGANVIIKEVAKGVGKVFEMIVLGPKKLKR